MRAWRPALALIVLVVFAAVAPGAAATSHSQAIIDSTSIDNAYPRQLVFKLAAHATAEITGVTLQYTVTGAGPAVQAKPDSFTPGTKISPSVTIEVNSSSSYIPVGSEFTYHWQVTTADGASLSSPDQTFVFLPPGPDWKTLSNDFMTVYYESGTSDIAANYLAAAARTYAKMGNLLKTTLAVVPVRTVQFNTEAEAARARPAQIAASDPSAASCGAHEGMTVILITPQSCGTAGETDTFRREFTRILVLTAAGAPNGQAPAWLEEGAVIYSQNTVGGAYATAFADAARADTLLPFDTMGTLPIEPATFALFEGQSYSMVKYLIDKDSGGFAALFAAIKQRKSFDDALISAYGFDLAGFQHAFRVANGLPAALPSVTAGPTLSPSSPTPQPAAAAAPTSTSTSSGVSRTTVIIFAVAFVFLVLAVVAYLWLMVLQARPPALPPPE